MGLKYIDIKLSLILLPLALLFQRPFANEESRKIIEGFSVVTVVMCLAAIGISLFQERQLLANQELSALVGMHASYLSLYASFAFFHFLKKIWSKEANILSYLFAIALLPCLVILSARMVILSSVLVLVLWFVLFQFDWKKLAILATAILILGAVGYQMDSVNQRFQEALSGEEVEFGNQLDSNGVTKTYGGKAIRIAIWKCAKDVVAENWMIGVGAGDVHKHLQESYKNRQFVLAWKYNNFNAHNLFLETIIAVGVLGVGLLLLLFYNLWSLSFRNRDLLQFAFFGLFLLFSMMESSLNVQRGLVFFVLVSCLFLNQTQEEA